MSRFPDGPPRLFPLISGKGQETIAEFFVHRPLYSTVSVEVRQVHDKTSVNDLLPSVVSRECEKCGQETRWEKEGSVYAKPRNFGNATYRCRNCTDKVLEVWFLWWLEDSKASFLKVGQYPKFEIEPPKDVRKALGPHVGLYTKGMTLRHHNYGLGALIYFRRLVEETTDEMLDLLVDTLKEVNPDAPEIEKVSKARSGRQFEQKVKIAAEALPDNLRPGGVNPFALLHDLLSKGVHNLDDEECCQIVDNMDYTLRFIYKELKTHAEERRAYAESLKGLQGSSPTSKGGGKKSPKKT